MRARRLRFREVPPLLEAVQADEETYNAILNGGEVVEFVDNITAYLDLKSGRVDAFVVDKVVGEWIIKNN